MKSIYIYSLFSIKIIIFGHFYSIYIAKVITVFLQKMPWNCQKSMYLQTNGDFEEATLFSFQKGPICKKMGISTGFYWFFLSFTVHTLLQSCQIKLHTCPDQLNYKLHFTLLQWSPEHFLAIVWPYVYWVLCYARHSATHNTQWAKLWPKSASDFIAKG